MLYFCVIFFIACVSSRYFTIKDKRFYDPKNGEAIFHGINYVQKVFPYETPIKKEDIDKIKSWGLNAIRTDISWPGLILKNGTINQTYLKHKVDMINILGQNQIFTLIQFHQDLFSEKFCGDGVPAWLIPQQISFDFGKPLTDQIAQFDNQTGRLKDLSYCNKAAEWEDFYKTYAVNRAFWALYNNQYGLLDQFKKYWGIVAKAFKNNPNIIAYQIINEPWPGNMYKNPLIMVPTLSEFFNLRDFHDQVAKQIRQNDPDQNIGFQPVTWLNVLPAGYSHAPGGDQYSDKSVLCFHYYSPPTLNMDLFVAARDLDMKRLDVGGLLTQFMAAPGSSSDPQDIHPQILDKCDQYNIGWFGWRYYPGTQKQYLIRVYAQRIGGTVKGQKYDRKTGYYQLNYQSSQQSGETKIFFPKEQYPNNFVLTIDAKVNFKIKFEVRESRYIIIQSKQLGNRQVNVKIQKINGQTEIKHLKQHKQLDKQNYIDFL